MTRRRDQTRPMALADERDYLRWSAAGHSTAGHQSWIRRWAWRLGGLWERASWTLMEELDEGRGFLWLPVFFGVGALTYVALPREPAAGALAIVFAATLSASIVAWSRGAPAILLMVLMALSGGLIAAKVRSDMVASPLLDTPVTATVQGRLLSIDHRDSRPPRILLDRLTMDPSPDGPQPKRIRLTVRTKGDLPEIGSHVRMLARLMPIPGPARPDGYDPRRAAFFKGIGAGGFVYQHPELIAPATGFSPRLAIARLRALMARRILDAGQGDAYAVAAALLVGERGHLSDDVKANLRAAGLSHVLAISGLHMALIAGTAYVAIRALLSLWPLLALRWPIHVWSAWAAIGTGAFYLLISGSSTSTVRAFLMAAIMFGAVILGRPGLSCRNLAIAALVILALWPESITQPGFQMSFASVLALISAWEYWYGRRRDRLADRTGGGWSAPFLFVWRLIATISVTTVIASLATAPFAAYHFQQIIPYSLVGNVLAMPITSLAIMPSGLLAMIAMPFGLEALPLALMTYVIDIMLHISDWVAEFPGAYISGLSLPATSLALLAAGLIWLCLWTRPWRLAGLAIAAIGLGAAPILSHQPDLLISSDGALVGLWKADGGPMISGSTRPSFVLDQWLGTEAAGLDRAALRSGLRCDASACLLETSDGVQISHVRSPEAFSEDCERSRIIITRLNAPATCAAELVVDAIRLEQFGSHAITFRNGQDRETTLDITTAWPRIRRPWHGTLSASR